MWPVTTVVDNIVIDIRKKCENLKINFVVEFLTYLPNIYSFLHEIRFNLVFYVHLQKYKQGLISQRSSSGWSVIFYPGEGRTWDRDEVSLLFPLPCCHT